MLEIIEKPMRPYAVRSDTWQEIYWTLKAMTPGSMHSFQINESQMRHIYQFAKRFGMKVHTRTEYHRNQSTGRYDVWRVK